MASLNNVVNVALLEEGRSVAEDNMNVCAIFTSNKDFLNSNNRVAFYKDAASVNADFGTVSEPSDFAAKFFGTSPNAVNFGGLLVMAYWRAADETVAASHASLLGEQLSEATTMPKVQSITDGAFSIDIDGSAVAVSNLNLSLTTSLDDIVSLLDAGISGATVTLKNNSILVTSDSTGATSTISYATAPTSGTFIGDALGLSQNSTSYLTQGADSATLVAETKVEALAAAKSLVNFKGCMFIDNPTDTETDEIATWCEANNTICYDVFDAASNLEVTATNPVWKVKLSGQTKYRCLFSKAGNRKMAVSYMARTHTVNFNAENSAMTMNLKELSVPAESYSQTEIQKAKRVGLDIYTTFKDVPKVLTSGANDFVDNVYNLMAYVDAVQVAFFNLLGTTPTKIPQTQSGVNALVDTGESVSERFRRAGFIGAGTWTSYDRFGDVDTFNRNIETSGYYWMAGSLATQTKSDREARKSPVMQNAIKNAGAFHSVDVLINFNL